MGRELGKGRKKKKLLTFLMVIGVLFTLSTKVWSESVTCPDVADVYIDQWYPDNNFNYKTRLLVATNTSHHGFARVLFLFDIPTELEPGNIASASIYFSPCASCGGGQYEQLVGFYALNQSFDEATVTWNTFPVDGSWDDSVYSSAMLPAGTGWNQAVNGEPPPDVQGMDVTTLLKGNLEKVKANGIMMKYVDETPPQDTWQNVASRESTDPLDFHPFITIEVQTATCSAWSDVISKYSSYVSGLAMWSDVITCYTQYSSQP